MVAPIFFVDGNTIWHARLAAALAEFRPVFSFEVSSGLLPSLRRSNDSKPTRVSISLPRGWASSTAFIGQSFLHRFIRRAAEACDAKPVLFLTSPAYAPLASRIFGELPIVSYTADDYRSYVGWGGTAIAGKERQIHQRSELSVFVSDTLRERAVREFGIDPARTFVSPNATERHFAAKDRYEPLPILAGRPRPLVGVLGALTERLNLASLAEVVSNETVGTFLVAGPASASVLEQYPVFRSAKVVVAGQIDHSRMHEYAKALDLAIIPYARNELNWHCSPMRLYDHLASGVPIISIRGCDQVDRCNHEGVHIVDESGLKAKVEELVARGLQRSDTSPPECFWDQRAKALTNIIDMVLSAK
ncbi:hypothetical protein [Novosphingobium aquae]|uniref:Glycosyltransferase n=1 Tax=Novosphingobium aquae TaxID=3133435 RepID=A0ABU8SDU9_9SPHN